MLEHFSLIFSFLALTIHALLAYACELTRCTHDNCLCTQCPFNSSNTNTVLLVQYSQESKLLMLLLHTGYSFTNTLQATCDNLRLQYFLHVVHRSTLAAVNWHAHSLPERLTSILHIISSSQHCHIALRVCTLVLSFITYVFTWLQTSLCTTTWAVWYNALVCS